MRPRKILLYGSGNAREHATFHALSHDQPDVEVRALILKENALMQREGGVAIVNGLQTALAFADEYDPDEVFVLSPTELIEGAADAFRYKGYKVFGASRAMAHLEYSKIFAKDFMRRHRIPTPGYFVAESVTAAEQYISQNWDKSDNGYVIKTDLFSMNAYDRTDTPANLEDALTSICRLEKSSPHTKFILEEKISGYELSLHLLVDGERYYTLPPVKDYKKPFPGGEGPMTHGVASVAAAVPYPHDLFKRVREEIIEPTLRGLREEGIDYRHILYVGLMISGGQPQVLEYNVRSGSPEWLSLLGLLATPLPNLLDGFERDTLSGRLWKEGCSCVTSFGLAAGYPETARTRYRETIRGLDGVAAGTAFGESVVVRNGVYFPSGGRVFAVRRTGEDFAEICRGVVAVFDAVAMNGLYYLDELSPLAFN